MELVDAIWIGPSGYQLVDGTVLEYGETVVQISEGEALASDHWFYEAPVVDEKGKNTNASGATD
jgi:hypothetical protein